MRACRRTIVVAGATCVALAIPAAAQARIKTVTMGPPSQKVANQLQKLHSEVNDFFPHRVTIHVGDSVRFVLAGFHTVDLPRTAGRVLPLVTPQGQTVAGSVDAAGQPFWFNGQPQLGFNPRLLKTTFGKRLRYSGRKPVRSGIPLGPAKPLRVKFTRAGRFTYYCNIHPGMKGKVRVRARSRRIPTAAQDARRVRNQVSRDLGIAKDLARNRPPANTVDVGKAGPHGVEYFDMFPLRPLRVHVGDSVLFRMTKGSFEDHTATFAPGSPEQGSTYLGQLVAGFQGNPFDPRSVYPSEAPSQTAATLTPTLHGNGFWNSGAMDRASATPLPGSNSVRFGAAGTYTFYCLIHPFMVGTIIVQ